MNTLHEHVSYRRRFQYPIVGTSGMRRAAAEFQGEIRVSCMIESDLGVSGTQSVKSFPMGFSISVPDRGYIARSFRRPN
jgi:hypothetical protein